MDSYLKVLIFFAVGGILALIIIPAIYISCNRGKTTKVLHQADECRDEAFEVKAWSEHRLEVTCPHPSHELSVQYSPVPPQLNVNDDGDWNNKGSVVLCKCRRTAER